MTTLKMRLIDHIMELRRRIIYVLSCFVITFIIGYSVSPQIQELLMLPLSKTWGNGFMIYTQLSEGFFIKMSLGSFFALLFTIPMFLYQAWSFIAPGLRENERKFVMPILIISPLLFLFGAAFAYLFLIPIMFEFFISLDQSAGSIQTVLMPHLSTYLEQTINMMKMFGVAFQFPLVLVLLNKIGILQKSTLKKHRRHAIVVAFIVGAILTPSPDVISQIGLSIPLVLMYEIAMWFMSDESPINK